MFQREANVCSRTFDLKDVLVNIQLDRGFQWTSDLRPQSDTSFHTTSPPPAHLSHPCLESTPHLCPNSVPMDSSRTMTGKRVSRRMHVATPEVSMKEVRDWKTLQGFDFPDEGASSSCLEVEEVGSLGGGGGRSQATLTHLGLGGSVLRRHWLWTN